MCCRTNVYPLDIPTACAVLKIGQFKPTWLADNLELPRSWSRFIEEESTTVTVDLQPDGPQPGMMLAIVPSISVYSHHANKRIAGAICFEIAAKYAEKVGGEIIQRGTVAGCRIVGETGDLVIARYPSEPMLWEKVCRGFQAVILGEDHHE